MKINKLDLNVEISVPLSSLLLWVLGLVLIILKVSNQIDWSGWAVFSPIIISIMLSIIKFIVEKVYKK